MPPRLTPLITGQYYHIFNRTIENKKLFIDSGISSLFLQLLSYYRSEKIYCSYSYFRKMPVDAQLQIRMMLQQKKYHKLIILSYCLMPNHFHLLIRQKSDNAVSKFMSDVLNSFTRYFNCMNKRKGPLFLPRFQAKHITSREQLIHVSRYIHLNPYVSNIVRIKALSDFTFSSFGEYLNMKKSNLSDTSIILSEFGNDPERYKSFVINHADHQKMLEYVKHAEKWSK